MESISSSKDENANQSTALGQGVLDKEGSSDKENANERLAEEPMSIEIIEMETDANHQTSNDGNLNKEHSDVDVAVEENKTSSHQGEGKKKNTENMETTTDQTETGDSGSDIIILDGSDTEYESCSEKEDTNLQSGNLNILPSSPNTDLSAELKNVNLDNTQKGNVVIIEESNSNDNKKDDHSSDAENDSEFDSDDSNANSDLSNPTQVPKHVKEDKDQAKKKRNKKQKENKKKIKKEKEDENVGDSNPSDPPAEGDKKNDKLHQVAQQIEAGTQGSTPSENKKVFGQGLRFGLNQKGDSVDIKTSPGSSLLELNKGKVGTQETKKIADSEKHGTAQKIEAGAQESKPLEKEKVFGQGVGYGLNQRGDSVEITTPQGSSLFEVKKGKAGTQETHKAADSGKPETQESVKTTDKIKSSSGSKENDKNASDEDEDVETEEESDDGSSVDPVLTRRQKRNQNRKKKTLKEQAEQIGTKDRENAKVYSVCVHCSV
jgi:hypothetical protein